MRLYVLCEGCEGEYSCDNYLGVFKTIEGMLFFAKEYIRDYYKESPLIVFSEHEGIIVTGGNFGKKWKNPFTVEIIDTETLT